MFAVAESLNRAEADEMGALIEEANELLLDEASADDSCRIDFANRARLSSATGEPLSGSHASSNRGRESTTMGTRAAHE